MNLETALGDSSYNMDLEKLKKKIAALYAGLLEQAFRQSNPGATPEELEAFKEDNAIEFAETEDFNEDADGLDKLLELLSEEDLDKVSEKAFKDPEVAKGAKMGAKSQDKSTAPVTVSLEAHKGGLFATKDKRVKKTTKALPTPRGKISRLIDDDPKVETSSLQEIWDAEREKLLQIVKRRNKEHGVKFW